MISQDTLQLDCQHCNMARNPSNVSCWPRMNVSLRLDVSHQWPIWILTKSSSKSNWGTPEPHDADVKLCSDLSRYVSTAVKSDGLTMFDQLVEMLMPRSSVRSMCTTSPAGCSIEKFVKTQLPGRAAICCSWSEAFNCWAPLDMRRLPCHGPGLRKAAKLGKTTWSMSLIIVLVGVYIRLIVTTPAELFLQFTITPMKYGIIHRKDHNESHINHKNITQKQPAFLTLELVPKKPSTIWQSWASASSTVASEGLGNARTEHICAEDTPRSLEALMRFEKTWHKCLAKCIRAHFISTHFTQEAKTNRSSPSQEL